MFLSLDSYELLCRDCLLIGEHQGHRYCTIAAAAGDARDVLRAAMEQCRAKERVVASTTQELQNLLPAFERVKLSCFEELDRQFNKVHMALDARKGAIAKHICTEVDSRMAKLQAQLQESSKTQAHIKRVCSGSQEAISNYSDLDLLSAAADVESELESVQRIEAKEGPCDSADIACLVNVDPILELVASLGDLASGPGRTSQHIDHNSPHPGQSNVTVPNSGAFDHSSPHRRPTSAGHTSRAISQASRHNMATFDSSSPAAMRRPRTAESRSRPAEGRRTNRFTWMGTAANNVGSPR